MKKLVSTMASLILLVLCSNANATVIKGSEFTAGLWWGKAFLNDESGKYAECLVSRKFNNRYYLGFGFTPSGFVLHLSHEQAGFFEDLNNSFQVASQVDRNAPIFLSAEKVNDTWLMLSYDNFDLIYSQLSKGNNLTLSSIYGNIRFSLKGSSRALKANLDCESMYENYSVSSNQAQGSAGSNSKKTFGAIAFSRDTGANGYSFQYDNRSGAEARALKECGAYASDCTVASSFSDACGALAVGDGNGWGASRAESIIKAERNALATCRSYDNTNCEIKVSVCSYE